MPTSAETAVEVHIVPGNSSGADTPVMISVVPQVGTIRTPSDICCVVDVSGSMGAEAVLKTECGGSTGHGLSVLDIVKHALKTIIRNLGAQDRLALVSYSNSATTVFGLTPCNDAGRAFTEAQLASLTPAGMTNLWDGLKVSLELLKAGTQPGRLQHVMLFTDGLPNINPPRGILPMLKRFKDKEEGKRLPCTISTFGFGYELDSELLSQLAIDGSGAYNFIPDAGFVGTVFVNAMANLLVTTAKDVTLTLEAQRGAVITSVLGGIPVVELDGSLIIELGALQFGQTKDVVVMMSGANPDGLTALVEYGTRGMERLQIQCRQMGPKDPVAVERQCCRLFVVDGIRNIMSALRLSTCDKAAGAAIPLAAAQQLCRDLSSRIRDFSVFETDKVGALLEDLDGQVMESVSREDWYFKWGVHYLPSLMFAHLTQQCNNFKDAGVQGYGGSLFQNLRDEADDIFLSLPAPTPSIVAPPPPIARVAALRAPVMEPVSMAAYHDRFAG